jgi:hypothetical protein
MKAAVLLKSNRHHQGSPMLFYLLKSYLRAILLPLAALSTLGFASTSAIAQSAICYNCPPEWADWASQLKAIKAKTGITVPPDN